MAQKATYKDIMSLGYSKTQAQRYLTLIKTVYKVKIVFNYHIANYFDLQSSQK